MSSIEEQLQDLIHTNLCLLRDNGHKINFQEGMFQGRNLAGFETVGHALLMIIDKTECARNIPWPLIDDRSLRAEFRKNFYKFIKMVNSKYPEANIPEVAASTLQFPGGLKFLRFMYRLSTFVLELELKRIMSPEEAKELMPRPLPSKKDRDNMVTLNIVEGACHEQLQNMQEIKEYQVTAMPLLEKLNNLDKTLQSDLYKVQTELEERVSRLNFDAATKKQLLDIENAAAIDDWDSVTNGKKRELEGKVVRVLDIRNTATAAATQLKAAQTAGVGAMSCVDRTSLDGRLLGDLMPLAKLAGRAVLNDQGQMRLETVYRAGAEAAHRLGTRKPQADPSQSPVLPTAQALLTDARTLHSGTSEALAFMDKMDQDNKKVIAELRPLMYEKVRGSVMPDHFKYLKPREVSKFAKPTFSVKKEIRKRRSGNWFCLMDILKKGHVKKNYKCSYKLRYEPVSNRLTSTVRGSSSMIPRFPTASRVSFGTSQKHFSSIKKPCTTTISKRLQETPSTRAAGPDISCRRSLYRNLPTGVKLKPLHELAPEQDNISEPSCSTFREFSFAPVKEMDPVCFSSLEKITETTGPSSAPLIPEKPLIPENIPVLSDKNETSTTVTGTPRRKVGRKSIDALVERFRRVKYSMAKNAEKDNCQE